MTDVAYIIDRLLMTYLSPPDKQDVQVRLGVDITDAVTTTVVLGGFTIPEDESLLRQGTILEADKESMRVVAYDDVAGSVEVTRGEYGTTATTHTTPLLMGMNLQFPRYAVFESVADNMIQLYPSLFTANVEYLTSVSAGIYPLDDDLAVELLSAWSDGSGWTGTTDVHGEIVDYHPLAGGRAVVLNNGVSGSMWFRYRRRMKKAESETDTLESIGVDERWAMIVMAGAAADLMAGKDVPASETEWVKSVLEAENIRVGTRMSIAGGLRQYRNMLLKNAADEMKSEYRTKVRMRDPMRSIV